jgi:hypothetical protein
MQISIRLGEPYWRQIDKKKVDLELPAGAQVKDMLRLLGEQYPALQTCLTDEELPPTVFLGDGLVSETTQISDGDEPTVLWAIAGG